MSQSKFRVTKQCSASIDNSWPSIYHLATCLFLLLPEFYFVSMILFGSNLGSLACFVEEDGNGILFCGVCSAFSLGFELLLALSQYLGWLSSSYSNFAKYGSRYWISIMDFSLTSMASTIFC